ITANPNTSCASPGVRRRPVGARTPTGAGSTRTSCHHRRRRFTGSGATWRYSPTSGSTTAGGAGPRATTPTRRCANCAPGVPHAGPRLAAMGTLAAIGRTPVVRLERLAGAESAEVWVKLESANPTGSYKDRMALAMIEGGERTGRLRPGQLVVEYTGGSTGSSLAFVCAVKGYPLRIVSSDAFSVEKIRTMRAFGADVELIPSPQGITPELIPAMVRRAAEIAAETGG